MTGFEPVTSSLPRKCSTPELHGQTFILIKSGRRDSNPRPSAWKADALPSELLPHWGGEDSNLRRPRQQIYSLPPLTAREPPRFSVLFIFLFQSWRRDSNPRQADYKSATLPLSYASYKHKNIYKRGLCQGFFSTFNGAERT